MDLPSSSAVDWPSSDYSTSDGDVSFDDDMLDELSGDEYDSLEQKIPAHVEATAYLQLVRDLLARYKPGKKSVKRPPLTAHQLWVLGVIYLGETRDWSPKLWVIQNFLPPSVWHGYEKSDGREIPVPWLREFLDFCVHSQHKRELSAPVKITYDPYGDESWTLTSISDVRCYFGIAGAMAKTGDHPHFLRLPTELRLRIYSMVLVYPNNKIEVEYKTRGTAKQITSIHDEDRAWDPVRSWEIRVRHKPCPFLDVPSLLIGDVHHETPKDPTYLPLPPNESHLALLSVSRQIYREAMPIFYRENSFVCTTVSDLRQMLGGITHDRRKHIRRIALLRPVYSNPREDWREYRRHGAGPWRNRSVWRRLAPILKQMEHLHLDIVMEKPDFDQWDVPNKPTYDTHSLIDALNKSGLASIVKVTYMERLDLAGDHDYDIEVDESERCRWVVADP